MFCLLYICKNATEMNNSNQIKSNILNGSWCGLYANIKGLFIISTNTCPIFVIFLRCIYNYLYLLITTIEPLRDLPEYNVTLCIQNVICYHVFCRCYLEITVTFFTEYIAMSWALFSFNTTNRYILLRYENTE